MKELIKFILPQKYINGFYHLPKAVLANKVYGSPARGLKIIGVTGTDGKSTTVNMIYQMLKAAGRKVSMVSTVNANIAGKSFDTGFHVSSPDSFTIQKFAKMAKENKDEYLVLEVTSHALDQYRFWGIKFDVGVLTNITHEHLDYHKTMDKYSKTKLNFIRKAKIKIINQNIKFKGIDTFTFGMDKGDFNQRQIKFKLKIPGDYNIENALAAFAVAFALGIEKTIAKKVLENFEGILGRMDEVKNIRGIRIVIDFAHTPNALENALKTLRDGAKGRLIAVFGSAGKRDAEKRQLLGYTAGEFADMVVITAEDPRGELEIINKEIIKGVESKGKVEGRNIFIVEDRSKAIDFAINKLAKKGDTIGIFGKGHEKSMNLDGKSEIPWSDFKAVEAVLDGQ